MNWLLAIIDSLIEFVRRNPLTCILLVMIAVFLPSAFGAVLIGIAIVILLLLAIPVIALFKLRRMSRRMEEQAHEQGFGRQGFNRQHTRRPDEGEVKVYATEDATEKRVSDNVGEYVDFEEVKEK